MANPAHTTALSNTHAPTLLDLPPEIQFLISEKLAYPDLLALTITHPHFQNHSLVRTSKTARNDWLIDRASHHLALPSRRQCRWSSDREFVSNPEVVDILRRRRRHLECAELCMKGRTEGICLVLEGQLCPYLDESNQYLRNEKWMSALGFGKTLTSQRNGRKRSERLFQAVTSWYATGLALLLAGALWLIM